MEFRTENVGGTDYLIAEKDGAIHQIDLRALGSWGLLLGISDPAEVVAAILRFKEEPVDPGQPNIWTPLYEALGAGLDAMSASGVPPEFMEDLLDPELGAPVPGPEVLTVLEEERGKGRAKIEECPDEWGDNSVVVGEVLANHGQAIKDARLGFVDNLAPVYELPPTPIPGSEDVNVPSGVITPGILA